MYTLFTQSMGKSYKNKHRKMCRDVVPEPYSLDHLFVHVHTCNDVCTCTWLKSTGVVFQFPHSCNGATSDCNGGGTTLIQCDCLGIKRNIHL